MGVGAEVHLREVGQVRVPQKDGIWAEAKDEPYLKDLREEDERERELHMQSFWDTKGTI